MKSLAIRVSNLTKTYPLRRAAVHRRVTDAVADSLRSVLRRGRFETFRALDCVSLDVHRGEVVGVIGRNGAGKSTLLKVLSRITEPSSGVVELYGKVGSLLEVGTGFHPELTGRENIYLNGAILGMRRREIDARFDEIVAFAEVDRFLDTPVKRYSSGMYVRLAFAVAAHLNPDILIVDEVLAVGDEQFQRKCLGKMQEVSQRDGRTVLFVSHNMAAVKSLCSRAILLSGGKIVTQGSAANVVTEYLTSARRGAAEQSLSLGGVRIERLELRDRRGGAVTHVKPYQDYQLTCSVSFEEPHPRIAISLSIRDEDGRLISDICMPEEGIGWVSVQRDLTLTYELPDLPLTPGPYWIDVAVYGPAQPALFEAAMGFEVTETAASGAGRPYLSGSGVVRLARGGLIAADQSRSDR